MEGHPDAQPRSRFRLLDEPLHRTRRERGALCGCEHPTHAGRARGPGSAVGAPGGDHGRPGGVWQTLWGCHREQRHQIPHVRRRVSQLHPLLSARRARKCPERPRDHFLRNVAPIEPLVPDGQLGRAGFRRAGSKRGLLRRSQTGQSSLRRQHRRHDDTRRGVALQPAWADARTGRQDLAHSRREVLSAAALRRGGRHTF